MAEVDHDPASSQHHDADGAVPAGGIQNPFRSCRAQAGARVPLLWPLLQAVQQHSIVLGFAQMGRAATTDVWLAGLCGLGEGRGLGCGCLIREQALLHPSVVHGIRDGSRWRSQAGVNITKVYTRAGVNRASVEYTLPYI